MKRVVISGVLFLIAAMAATGAAQAQQSGAVTRGPATPGGAGPACGIQILAIDSNCNAPEAGTCALVLATNRRAAATNLCVQVMDDNGVVACDTLGAGQSREFNIYLGPLSAAQTGRIAANCLSDEQVMDLTEPT